MIDAQYTESEVSALGDMIEQTGRRLTSIFITHGHYDHYYGLGQLVARFRFDRLAAGATRRQTNGHDRQTCWSI